ncbi:MAG: tandem-95 repeat protein, partial [Betaproteobacteria bacterium]|nr:tandem-95 repeat protein [Betaproteobacteria bacterium]
TAVFELQGASDVTLSHLSVTGAQTGIWASNTANSDRLTVEDSAIYGNTGAGVSMDTSNDAVTFRNDLVHNNGSTGLYLRGAGDLVDTSQIYGNAQWGIDAIVGLGGTGAPIQIMDNKVHDNASGGITASTNVQITGNEVYGHTGGNRSGISITSTAVASGNFVHDNDIGISVTYGGLATGNEVYANKTTGISAYSATVRGNRVYSNPTGIADTGYTQVENNVVYANRNVGISVSGGHNGQMIRNNTLYQPVGDGILVAASLTDVTLYNNIVWVDAGYAMNVGASQTRFVSDYDLFNTPGPGARVALWSGTQETALADWQTAASQDANSKAGDPLFLDIDGADNVLGEQGVITGNGFDDNFGLRANSPAIDAANMYVAPATDIQGLARRDDPSTVNTGTGLPLYVATPQATSGFAVSASDTKLNYRTGDSARQYTLPFAFTFYGKSYTSVYIDTNGFLQFNGGPGTSDSNTLDGLVNNVRIAPLWDNLNTYSSLDATRDLYVNTSVAGQFTVRWATVQEGTNDPVNFSVTLFQDGSFRFDYGPSATGLTPTVGVSAGNGQTYVLATYDGQSDLSSAASLLWQATPGLTYYDIGAYEFQGDSNDHTPPTVTSVTQLPADGGTTAAAFTSFQVNFSEALDGISARSPANYELVSAGADRTFGTPDDSYITLKPGYSFPETNLTLQLPDGVLPDGLYRLKLSGTLGIFDTAGNLLDGNGDGTPGGDYVRTFTIDRTGNQPPTATDATATTQEDTAKLVTLAGTDPNGDPLTFSLVGQPPHGTLTAFDPVAHTVLYTPDANFNGTDSFRFRVDDGNLGTDDGTILVNVLPVNDVPQAPGTTAITDEDTAVAILLPASDVETPQQQLTYAVGAAPQHGTLTPGANGLWTYTPDANYNGSDFFTYTVTDRGDPDGALTNAATSAPGTVSITVRSVNDAPVIQTIGTVAVNEGSMLSYQIPASDVDSANLTYSLVNNTVVGAKVDATTGLFTWTPADGPLKQPFTVRVSDGSLATDQTFDVSVANVPPTITLTGVSAIDLGQTYSLSFGATDPGTDTISAWSVNWGDGVKTSLAGTATGGTHAYAQGGQYAITVQATDEDGTYTSNPLALKVITPNRPPVVPAGQSATTNEDQAVVLTLAYADPDNDPVTVTIDQAPQHGVLSGFDAATHRITYTPAANYNGTDGFTFSVNDGISGSTPGTFGLTVLPVNDAPVADGQTLATTNDVAIQGQLTGSDVETPANALTFQLATAAQHGVAVVNADGTFTYTPTLGYVGQDVFDFSVTDTGDPAGSGTGAGAPATSAAAAVTITVTQPNRAPVAVADQYATHPGDTLVVDAAQGVLSNDSDPDGNPITVVANSAGDAGGTLALLSDGSFTYTSRKDFAGTETFTYTVEDSLGAGTQTQVRFDVVNRTPQLAPVNDLSVKAGAPVTVALAGSDPDAAQTLTYRLDTSPAGAVIDAATGVIQFVPATPATYDFTATVQDDAGASASQSFRVIATPSTLQVVSVTPTTSGVAVRFNQPLDASVLNLYAGSPTAMGGADLVLTGPNGKAVSGSLIVDADRAGFTFLKTGGALDAGSYTLALASRADGIVTPAGGLLDGNGDGTAGDGFVTSFTVSPSTGALVSVGEIARGPGQSLAIPAVGYAFPVTLDNAAGATSVSFSLHYDPALLTVSGFSGGTLPAGAQVSVDTSVAGVLQVSITSQTAFGAGRVVLGDLAATVPAGATYGAKDLLHLTDVQLDGGASAARGDDGLHVVAFLGDASGDGTYTTLDFQDVNRILLKQDTGFGAWPLVDPAIVADVDRNGVLQSVDALRLAYQIGGATQANIPAIPSGLPPLVFAGADPSVTLGSVTAVAGTAAVVPLSIDTAAGLQSVQATVRYDMNALALTGVARTALSAGFAYTVVHSVPGEVTIDATSQTPLDSGTGELFGLVFDVKPAAAGVQAIDLVNVRLNDTWLTVNPAPVAGADSTDGAITVTPVAPPPAGPSFELQQTALLGTLRALDQIGGVAPAAAGPATPVVAGVATRPLVDLQSPVRGFALDDTTNGQWLDHWLKRPGKTGPVNGWTVLAPRSGPRN